MRAFALLLLVLSTIALAGCNVIGDIFQAGFAVGVIAVVLILVLVVFIARKLKR